MQFPIKLIQELIPHLFYGYEAELELEFDLTGICPQILIAVIIELVDSVNYGLGCV